MISVNVALLDAGEPNTRKCCPGSELAGGVIALLGPPVTDELAPDDGTPVTDDEAPADGKPPLEALPADAPPVDAPPVDAPPDEPRPPPDGAWVVTPEVGIEGGYEVASATPAPRPVATSADTKSTNAKVSRDRSRRADARTGVRGDTCSPPRTHLF